MATKKRGVPEKGVRIAVAGQYGNRRLTGGRKIPQQKMTPIDDCKRTH